MRVRNIPLASEREILLHSLPFLLDGDDVDDEDAFMEAPRPKKNVASIRLTLVGTSRRNKISP